MKDYKNKWINKILVLQHEDGSWGRFHSMSKTEEGQITTEQALRRLYILGLTKDDYPIKRAISYMLSCLSGKVSIPDRKEKVLNWDAFEALMLASWIRIFDQSDESALIIANMWRDIIKESFKNGFFDEETYQKEYRKHIPVLNKNERLIGVSQFYMVNILKGLLDKETESRFIDYIINFKDGIYYVYGSKLTETPLQFESRRASRYIGALEQIQGYSCAKEKLDFAFKWLISLKDESGRWDMGISAKDKMYFPVSDSWRNPAERKNDCTNRILNLFKKLNY